MRKLFKIIKYLFLTFIGLILLGLLTVYVGHKWIYPVPYSETQTVPDIKSDGFFAGIGFTMSVFITLLAFEDGLIINNSKLVILISSLTAGIIGFLILKKSLRKSVE